MLRRGYHNGWLLDNDGQCYGLNLGIDPSYPDHKLGIDDILHQFGVDQNKSAFGIYRHCATALPKDDYALRYYGSPIVYKEIIKRPNQTWKVKDAILVYSRHGAEEMSKAIKGEKFPLSLGPPFSKNVRTNPYLKAGLLTAWDFQHFGVHVRNPKQIANLKFLYESMLRLDLAIWLGNLNGAVGFDGLNIAVPSKVPVDILKKIRAQDVDAHNMRMAAAETDVERHLRSSGKQWATLKPKWTKSCLNMETAYSVVFWLSPVDRSSYNAGIFTVEDLLQWAEDKGPVIRKP